MTKLPLRIARRRQQHALVIPLLSRFHGDSSSFGESLGHGVEAILPLRELRAQLVAPVRQFDLKNAAEPTAEFHAARFDLDPRGLNLLLGQLDALAVRLDPEAVIFIRFQKPAHLAVQRGLLFLQRLKLVLSLRAFRRHQQRHRFARAVQLRFQLRQQRQLGGAIRQLAARETAVASAVQPRLHVRELLLQRLELRPRFRLLLLLHRAHPLQSFATQRELDGGGGLETTAQRSLFEDAFRRDGAAGVGGFQLLDCLDAQDIAQQMLDVEARDGMRDRDFAKERTVPRAHAQLPDLGGIQQRLRVAARRRLAQNLQRLAIICGVLHDEHPAVAPEKEFERGPPAFRIRLHLDETAELLDAVAELLPGRVKERIGTGRLALGKILQILDQLSQLLLHRRDALPQWLHQLLNANPQLIETRRQFRQRIQPFGVGAGTQPREQLVLHDERLLQAFERQRRAVLEPLRPAVMPVIELLLRGLPCVAQGLDLVLQLALLPVELVDLSAVRILLNLEAHAIEQLADRRRFRRGSSEAFEIISVLSFEPFQLRRVLLAAFLGLLQFQHVAGVLKHRFLAPVRVVERVLLADVAEAAGFVLLLLQALTRVVVGAQRGADFADIERAFLEDEFADELLHALLQLEGDGLGKCALERSGIEVQVTRRGHLLEVISLPVEETFVAMFASQPGAEGVVGKHLAFGRNGGVVEPVRDAEVGVTRRGVRAGEFEAHAPRLPLWFLAPAIGRAGEFKRDKCDSALAEEMALAVAHLVRVAQAIAHEIAALLVPGGGAVRAPMLAEQDVLNHVEQRGLAGAERAGEEDVVVHIKDLAEAVPVQRDEAGERNALAHKGSAGF